MKYYEDVTRKMERTLHDVRRWIRSHYTNADNVPLMLHILQIYADPIVRAFESIETYSEWMKHDVRELSTVSQTAMDGGHRSSSKIAHS